MPRAIRFGLVSLTIVGAALAVWSWAPFVVDHAAWAQRPGVPPRAGQDRGGPERGPDRRGGNYQVPPKSELPEDARVTDLYLKFVEGAEKLAKEYESRGKTDQARKVYLEILKILPNYKPARQKLDEYHEKEAKADKKSVDVHANKGWQETGITVIAGKPIKFTASGTWICKVTQEVGPNGLKVSEELQGLNLGSLVGVIVPPPDKDKSSKDKNADVKLQPFAIGEGKEMVAPFEGKLMLRIYDIQTADNSGKLKVEITGTFERK